MFVNPPPLLLMFEQSFGMSTNYILIEYIELSFTKVRISAGKATHILVPDTPRIELPPSKGNL